MKRRWKKVILIVSALFAVLMIVGAILLGPPIYGLLNNPFNDRKFDRSIWLKAETSNQMKNPRGPMAENLRSKYLHKGMLRKDVQKLLGKTGNSIDEKQFESDSYFLGHWGFMSIDGDRLIIRYDKSGRLVSTEIYMD